MASSIQLNSTNNSEMKIEYQGTSGVPKTVVVPDRNMTLAGTDEVIGVNQTWQNVTASRAIGTTYTNSTGKPILVAIAYTNNVANSIQGLSINGTVVYGSGINVAGYGSSFVLLVPNGATYVTSTNLGSMSLVYWAELK